MQHPAHYRQMLEDANRHPPLTLRVNRRRTTVDNYVARLEASNIAARALGGSAVVLERPMPVERIPGFAEGEVSVQDAAAQYAALAARSGAGSRVLDACAAPGGKTAHILELADVDLVAVDTDPARLERVRSNLARLKLTARIACGDAADPRAWWDGKPVRAHTRGRAVLGLGRRAPPSRHQVAAHGPATSRAFAQRQRDILDALWQLLASGGKLLYATCSVFHEENQEQIERFLERHHDARRLTLPGPHTNAQQLAGQILPDEQHDGFFYALLQKS